jgi:hypothetical protein
LGIFEDDFRYGRKNYCRNSGKYPIHRILLTVVDRYDALETNNTPSFRSHHTKRRNHDPFGYRIIKRNRVADYFFHNPFVAPISE